MPYKTIILELLESNPQLHEQLRRNRVLAQVLESCAIALKVRHEILKDQLSTTNLNTGPNQIRSMAMEIGVQEMENRLLAAFPLEGREPPSLDDAMEFMLDLRARD